jgi:hypothetical protein
MSAVVDRRKVINLIDGLPAFGFTIPIQVP